MPSIHIHLAIAERYVEKHEINNKNEPTIVSKM